MVSILDKALVACQEMPEHFQVLTEDTDDTL